MKTLFCAALMLFTAGCASWGYKWTSDVPEGLRTVAVPNFENNTHDAELGEHVAQYTLREFQREGTFKIRRQGDAAIEIQGVITRATAGGATYDRNYTDRAYAYRYAVTAVVAAVDKRSGKTLFEGREFKGETTFASVAGDHLTGRRNAAFRVANDLARQIVDAVVNHPYAARDAGAKKPAATR